ncbi:hypothetical protein JR316_0005749 [Psilocybe cubensis]|uniref:Uncharacterized protein n=1 Tax=Psilocybe cubensis TaxID=181762 RepID=A0ACB8H0C0_PSICU|nr:hypothetical protein JR316_0005749 [Psilocybe cubensis]KAH9481228.1 hypothetical protein JR316_0005749 [Psilocybe cubensis]
MAINARFPPEILDAIFEEYLSGTILSVDTKNTFFAVSEVCTLWHKISTRLKKRSNAWTRLHIHVPDSQGRTPVYPMLNFWLTNSRDEPLDIVMHMGKYCSGRGAIENALLKHIGRARSQTHGNPLWNLELLRSCFSLAPRLQTVWYCGNMLAATARDGDEDEDVNNKAISVHKSQSHLALEYAGEDYHSMRSAGAMVLLLQELRPVLRSLALRVPMNAEDPSDVYTTLGVELEELQELTISESDNLLAFLPRIRAPNLKGLKICRSTEDDVTANEQAGKCVLDFLTLSHLPPISELELNGVQSIKEEDYARIFGLLPLLQTLVIRNSTISDIALETLNMNGSDKFCQLLKRLDLINCENVHGKTIYDVVSSRLAKCVLGRGEQTSGIQITVEECAFSW